MKSKFKRLIGLIVAFTMLLSMIPATFAASTTNFVDFPMGWSKAAMEAAVDNGLLNGFENNEIRPGANLTRAQMAAIIARAFGAQTKADISGYVDVSPSSWYYNDIAKAVKMGAMHGVSASQMLPDAPITREEVFTTVARVLVLSKDDVDVLNKFNDQAQISSWAVKYIAALTERGYVNGDNFGNCNPKSYITREEFAQFMHNTIRTYITEPGTYSDDKLGITVVRVDDVTLKGFTNTRDIVLADGVGEGKVNITDVKIEQRLLARGGTITLKNTTVGECVVVNNVNGVTYFKNYRDEKVFDGLVENTKAKFLTRSSGGSSSSRSYVTVRFYDGYSESDSLGTVSVRAGAKVPLEKFPAITEDKIELGYSENEDIADIYLGIHGEEGYTHKILPTFWYVYEDEETGEKSFAPFDENVVVTKNTNVYLLSKALSLGLTLTGGAQTFGLNSGSTSLGVTAFYNDDTRAMDSVKDMSVSGRRQLNLALSLPNIASKYDEISDQIVGKLTSLGLLEVDGDVKHIKIMNIPVSISEIVTEEMANNMVKQHLRDVVHDESELEYELHEVISFIDIRELATELGLGAYIGGLTDAQIEAYIVNYIINIDNEAEKIAAADQIYEVLQSDDDYAAFMHSLFNEDTFEVNEKNYTMIAAISDGIKKLTFAEAISTANNSAVNEIIELFGEDFVKGYYDTMKADYCDSLDDVIDLAENAVGTFDADYTTSLTLKLNIIEDVYKPLFEKIQPQILDELRSADIYYDENVYLKFLMEHDVLDYLLDGVSSLATEELTGYSLKGILDYYDYALMLLIVGDDALYWYGDNDKDLTAGEIKILFDTIFGKLLTVNSKLSEVLDELKSEDTLSPQFKNALGKVESISGLLDTYGNKIKSLFGKALYKNIIDADDTTVSVADMIVGKDEPVVNVDMLYELFYSYDDTLKAKLQNVIDSGKLEAAVNKFESTSIGELFTGNGEFGTVAEKLEEFEQTGKIASTIDSVYDLLVIIAQEGIEPFRTEEDNLTVIDSYEVKVGQMEFLIRRFYE